MDDFESEIRRLGVKGGAAEPERRLLVLGVLVVAAGLVIAFIGLNLVRGAESELEQGDGVVQAIFGVGLALVGAIVWARYSMARYLRYWLIRNLYEQRAVADRIEGAGRQ